MERLGHGPAASSEHHNVIHTAVLNVTSGAAGSIEKQRICWRCKARRARTVEAVQVHVHDHAAWCVRTLITFEHRVDGRCVKGRATGPALALQWFNFWLQHAGQACTREASRGSQSSIASSSACFSDSTVRAWGCRLLIAVQRPRHGQRRGWLWCYGTTCAQRESGVHPWWQNANIRMLQLHGRIVAIQSLMCVQLRCIAVPTQRCMHHQLSSVAALTSAEPLITSPWLSTVQRRPHAAAMIERPTRQRSIATKCADDAARVVNASLCLLVVRAAICELVRRARVLEWA